MTLLATFALTLVVALAIAMVALALARHPQQLGRRPADGEASVTGACGDTMTLRFSVHDGCIADTSFRTEGCAYSFSCLQAAADAAGGRTPLQVLDIDAELIARRVGHLPRDHRHCAILAARTLQAAVDRYMQGQLSAAKTTAETAHLT
jgi:nitrogen fixation NifU-like protein